MNDELEILKAALVSTGDTAALARVRANADAIRAALDLDIDLGAEEFSGLDQHPEWVGQVYAALGGGDEDGADSAVAQAIGQLRAEEATEIGEAFVGLMELLAECRYDWKEQLRSIRYPDPDSPEWRSLLTEPSVVQAGRHGYALMSHTGLTPAIIYEATRGLHLLFDRLTESLEERSPQARLLMQRKADKSEFRVIVGESAAFVPHDLVRAEIAGTPDIPEDAIDPLANWISDVVRLQPFLVEGYRYSIEQHGFEKLSGLDLDMPDDLVAQWSRPERRTGERRVATRTGPTTSRRSFDHSY